MIIAFCSICNGPISSGEPVVSPDGVNVSHRFKVTCEFQKEEDARLALEIQKINEDFKAEEPKE